MCSERPHEFYRCPVVGFVCFLPSAERDPRRLASLVGAHHKNMKIVQNNKLRSYGATQGVLDTHESKWSALVAFAAGVTKFNSIVTEINDLAQTQASRNGASNEKSYALDALASAAFEVSAALHAYAVAQEDFALEGRVDFSLSSISLGRESSVLSRCRDIHAAAVEHAGDLADYGITAAKLTALKKKVDAFEGSMNKPRQHVAESAAATVTLAERFKDADEVLNKCLDKLVFQFKDSAPDFFNEYQSARIVVDLRGGRSVSKVSPTPAPQPA